MAPQQFAGLSQTLALRAAVTEQFHSAGPLTLVIAIEPPPTEMFLPRTLATGLKRWGRNARRRG